jgi:hypothetical protein
VPLTVILHIRLQTLLISDNPASSLISVLRCVGSLPSVSTDRCCTRSDTLDVCDQSFLSYRSDLFYTWYPGLSLYILLSINFCLITVHLVYRSSCTQSTLRHRVPRVLIPPLPSPRPCIPSGCGTVRLRFPLICPNDVYCILYLLAWSAPIVSSVSRARLRLLPVALA